ncbi:MAG: hypothetical protein GY793_07595 [Proteobacteria bacterium]|nr:hypothetical protein [Pseudomonadota bacterium]
MFKSVIESEELEAFLERVAEENQEGIGVAKQIAKDNGDPCSDKAAAISLLTASLTVYAHYSEDLLKLAIGSTEDPETTRGRLQRMPNMEGDFLKKFRAELSTVVF